MQFRHFFFAILILATFTNAAFTQSQVVAPCEIAYIGLDSSLQQKRMDTANQLFFTYTPDTLRPFFEQQEYLRTDAYLSYIEGGHYILHLHFWVASPDAPQEYQALRASSVLNIKLMNGSTLSLRNGKTSRGQYDGRRQAFVFKGQYPLSGAAIRRLQNREVDRIQVYWASGYECYEIYDLDFFRTQLDCIQNYIANNNF